MITLNLNGKDHQLDVTEDMPLLWAIRDVVGYTGTKFGCGMGLCGSCTIHIDGQATRSCITPVSLAQGRKVTTIDHLHTDKVGEVVQQAWLDIGGHHDSPQLRQGRFHNLSPRPADMPAPGARVLWNALFNKPRSTVPRQPLPVLSPSRAELDATVDGSLFRLGHSTLLLKLAGSWWLTDPVFSERASPLPFAGPKRFHAPPVALADLPPIRGVILSHDHYDHLDRAAIKALVPLVELFLAPLGVGDRLLAWGVPPGKVRQLDWWQGIEAGGLRLTATPAQHFSGRGLHDGNRTLWCSWVIESAELKLFFSGDSGYFDGFAEIGRRYGPFDLTMLETGAYNEHWPYVHMHPQQTLQAHRDLGGRWLLPIHNGTFDLTMHAWYEPFERILELATEHGVRVSTPMMGERIDLQAPHAGRRWWREVVDSETQVQGYGCCRS